MEDVSLVKPVHCFDQLPNDQFNRVLSYRAHLLLLSQIDQEVTLGQITRDSKEAMLIFKALKELYRAGDLATANFFHNLELLVGLPSRGLYSRLSYDLSLAYLFYRDYLLGVDVSMQGDRAERIVG